MIELPVGIPVWGLNGFHESMAMIVDRVDGANVHCHSVKFTGSPRFNRNEVSPIDPASSAGMALTALKHAAENPLIVQAAVREVGRGCYVLYFDGVQWFVYSGSDVLAMATTGPASIDLLRDKLERRAVKAWRLSDG